VLFSCPKGGVMANDIIERLRHRVDVFSKSESKTEFGELTYLYERTHTVWAEITPTFGKENSIDGDSIQVSVTHKITTRKGAIKEPRNDMYFVFQGQKYEVLYFIPHYRRNDLVEYYCKLIIETEEDYNGR
jgi:SPP1 family predicted phage head-tail adaptor